MRAAAPSCEAGRADLAEKAADAGRERRAKERANTILINWTVRISIGLLKAFSRKKWEYDVALAGAAWRT